MGKPNLLLTFPCGTNIRAKFIKLLLSRVDGVL